jgi:hypothetical protein
MRLDHELVESLSEAAGLAKTNEGTYVLEAVQTKLSEFRSKNIPSDFLKGVTAKDRAAAQEERKPPPGQIQGQIQR